MDLNVPVYNRDSGFQFIWENDYDIEFNISNYLPNMVILSANAAGFISLARHLLELSQRQVPEHVHIHLDQYNSLNDGSMELIIEKSIKIEDEIDILDDNGRCIADKIGAQIKIIPDMNHVILNVNKYAIEFIAKCMIDLAMGGPKKYTLYKCDKTLKVCNYRMDLILKTK